MLRSSRVSTLLTSDLLTQSTQAPLHEVRTNVTANDGATSQTTQDHEIRQPFNPSYFEDLLYTSDTTNRRQEQRRRRRGGSGLLGACWKVARSCWIAAFLLLFASSNRRC